MAGNPNPKITTNWRPIAGEPSSAWRRLWAKLLATKKITPPATHEAAGDKKYEDENDKTIEGD